MAYRSYGSTYKRSSGGGEGSGYRQFQAMKTMMDMDADEEERGMKKKAYESERSDAELKQRIAQEDEDIMHRATYGATQSDILKDMEARGPGMGPDTQPVSAFKKNPMTLDMMKNRARIDATARTRRPPRGPVDRTQEAKEAALTVLDSMDPGKYNRSAVAETIAFKFPKLKWQSDPELQEALNRFPDSVESAKKPGMWERFTGMATRAAAALTPSRTPAAPAQAPEPIQDEPEPELPEQESDNPYADEYPDAFLEDGVWKVERNGKKYRLEGE